MLAGGQLTCDSLPWTAASLTRASAGSHWPGRAQRRGRAAIGRAGDGRWSARAHWPCAVSAERRAGRAGRAGLPSDRCRCPVPAHCLLTAHCPRVSVERHASGAATAHCLSYSLPAHCLLPAPIPCLLTFYIPCRPSACSPVLFPAFSLSAHCSMLLFRACSLPMGVSQSGRVSAGLPCAQCSLLRASCSLFLLPIPAPCPRVSAERPCSMASTRLPSARCSLFPAAPCLLTPSTAAMQHSQQQAPVLCPLILLPIPSRCQTWTFILILLSIRSCPCPIPCLPVVCSLSVPPALRLLPAHSPACSMAAPCLLPNHCPFPACCQLPSHSCSLPTTPCPLLAPCPPGIPGCQASLGQQAGQELVPARCAGCSPSPMGAPRSCFAVQSW